ncbi:hypothetical protein PCL_12387 [Purpureocillium lilacinum]|uniref:Uncharacterized protein n=1 Tax=Purpureocillium lilacinum TaxID=33203 RepID=A0A2U3E976_PURLI|nr:hypothetical protein PCL_12387 [Purpureocillium lilacinum]
MSSRFAFTAHSIVARARVVPAHDLPLWQRITLVSTPSPPTICKYKAAAGVPRRFARSLDGPSTTTPSPRWRHVVHGPQNAKGGGGHRHKWPLDVRDAHGATGVAAAVTPATGRAAEPDHGCDSWRAANFVRLATGPPPHQRVPNACTRAHTHNCNSQRRARRALGKACNEKGVREPLLLSRAGGGFPPWHAHTRGAHSSPLASADGRGTQKGSPILRAGNLTPLPWTMQVFVFLCEPTPELSGFRWFPGRAGCQRPQDAHAAMSHGECVIAHRGLFLSPQAVPSPDVISDSTSSPIHSVLAWLEGATAPARVPYRTSPSSPDALDPQAEFSTLGRQVIMAGKRGARSFQGALVAGPQTRRRDLGTESWERECSLPVPWDAVVLVAETLQSGRVHVSVRCAAAPGMGPVPGRRLCPTDVPYVGGHTWAEQPNDPTPSGQEHESVSAAQRIAVIDSAKAIVPARSTRDSTGSTAQPGAAVAGPPRTDGAHSPRARLLPRQGSNWNAIREGRHLNVTSASCGPSPRGEMSRQHGKRRDGYCISPATAHSSSNLAREAPPPPPLRSSMFAKHVAFAANIDAQASMAADKTQSRGSPPPRARHAQVPPSNERRRHQTRLAGKANRSERRTGEGWDTAAAIRPCRPGLARLLASGEFASHPGRRGREGRKASCWLGPPGSMQRRPEQMRAAHRIYTSRIGIISRGSVQPGAERKGGRQAPKTPRLPKPRATRLP